MLLYVILYNSVANNPVCNNGDVTCVVSENYIKKHAMHAAFVVAKHDVVPMDLVAIDLSNGQRLYSFLSVGWGLIADVDIESEKYRSMGNARFALMAVIKIASLYTTDGIRPL